MTLSLDHNIRAAPRGHSRAPPGSLNAKTADDGFGPDHHSEQRRPG
jgi:hypothetical protein